MSDADEDGFDNNVNIRVFERPTAIAFVIDLVSNFKDINYERVIPKLILIKVFV